MKVGDLVRLSARGLKKKCLEWIPRDDVGILAKIELYDNYSPSYKVVWCKASWNGLSRRWIYNRSTERRDLKFVK